MRRSEVNSIITEVKNFLSFLKFMLPVWAYWSPGDWKGRYSGAEMVVNSLDRIYRFRQRNFMRRVVIIHYCNGNWDKKDKMYSDYGCR